MGVDTENRSIMRRSERNSRGSNFLRGGYNFSKMVPFSGWRVVGIQARPQRPLYFFVYTISGRQAFLRNIAVGS